MRGEVDNRRFRRMVRSSDFEAIHDALKDPEVVAMMRDYLRGFAPDMVRFEAVGLGYSYSYGTLIRSGELFDDAHFWRLTKSIRWGYLRASGVHSRVLSLIPNLEAAAYRRWVRKKRSALCIAVVKHLTPNRRHYFDPFGYTDSNLESWCAHFVGLGEDFYEEAIKDPSKVQGRMMGTHVGNFEKCLPLEADFMRARGEHIVEASTILRDIYPGWIRAIEARKQLCLELDLAMERKFEKFLARRKIGMRWANKMDGVDSKSLRKGSRRERRRRLRNAHVHNRLQAIYDDVARYSRFLIKGDQLEGATSDVKMSWVEGLGHE